MADRRFDAEVLRLRFSDEHCDDLPHLLRLGLLFGRYRVVKKLRHLMSEPEYRHFLLEKALPCVPISGDAVQGFAVDELMLAEIAKELGQPLPELLTSTVHFMLHRQSRHIAKLYVLARLAGNESLVRRLQPEFDARTAHPRRQLAAAVRARFAVELLQEGDDDDYNPKSAWLFAGPELVVKEHLRLHIDPSRIDGYSNEEGVLKILRHPAWAKQPHPRLVELLDVATVDHHELLLLRPAKGVTLDGKRHPSARRITQQLAEVLGWLHARGIVYADVKPRNLLFDGEDITLCDFGMARMGLQVTSMLSTLEYVPPEMARTFTATSKADVFQLGIVVHQLYTGRHPFSDGEGVEVALANLWDEPRLEPDLPKLERDLIAAMLAKEPGERPFAEDVARALA